jgi:hypothetical protein
MSVWRAREAKRVTTYGSARWAETREVRKADRRSSTTSRAKTGRLSPAGGRGSAACFCSIRPMRRALLTIRYWRATAGAPLFVRSVHDFEFNRGPLGARSYSFEAVSPAPIAAAGDGAFFAAGIVYIFFAITAWQADFVSLNGTAAGSTPQPNSGSSRLRLAS